MAHLEVVRPATEVDTCPDGDFRFILENEGQAVGFIVASRREGTVYIHDMEVRSENKWGAAMLVFALRAALRSEGEVQVVAAVRNMDLMDAMSRRGFRFVAVLMEGEI